MSSQKQLDANRRNAQLSTGPRSAEGKAISSQNALKTGIYARGNIIGHEGSWLLEELIEQFSAEHRPATPTERSLVDQLIHCEWMLRRYAWLETETWRAAGTYLSPEQLNHTREGHSFIREPAIARIQRQCRAAQREFRDILAELRRVKSENQTPTQPVDPKPASPQNGFVPSKNANGEIPAEPEPLTTPDSGGEAAEPPNGAKHRPSGHRRPPAPRHPRALDFTRAIWDKHATLVTERLDHATPSTACVSAGHPGGPEYFQHALRNRSRSGRCCRP